MALDPTLKSALEKAGFRAATSVKIELKNSTVKLFDGSGLITIRGETYEGIDDLFGTLDALDAISEAIANEAPQVTLNLMVPESAGLAQIGQPEQQNSLVTVFFAVVDYATGVATAPEVLWVGRLDTAKIQSNETRQSVELNTVSAFDRLFSDEEGARLNPTWHNQRWAGETGLNRVVEATAKKHWGAETTGTSSGGRANRGGPESDPHNRQEY